MRCVVQVPAIATIFLDNNTYIFSFRHTRHCHYPSSDNNLFQNNTGEIIHQLMTHRSKIYNQLSALDTYASAHTQDYNNQMQVVQTSIWAHTMKGYMQYLMKETGGLVYHDLRCDSSNNPVAINTTPELRSMNDFFMGSVKLVKNLQVFLLNWRQQSHFLDCSEDFDMPSDCQ